MKQLAGKIAIVTGASSGMGHAIASLFAEEGAKVILGGRNNKRGLQLEASIKAKGGDAFFVAADVSTPEGNEVLLQSALEQYGGLDILVTSAGMLGIGRLTDLSTALWEKTLQTNLSSVFFLSKMAIPEMLKRGNGVIVVIGSIAGEKVFPNHPAYCASKGALLPLVKQIALDYGPEIRANVISPGPVDTPLIWDSAKAFPDPASAVAEAANSTLMQRLGTPQDIARAALFLAGEGASWITGANMVVDGGRMIP